MCTSVIVGEKATADGSFLLARSADSSALKAQHFVIHEAREWPEGSMYRTQDHKGATAFEWPQPAHSMRFTTVPNWQTQLHGAVGFNEAGVGLTGTESIFARDDALAIDPYNKASGPTFCSPAARPRAKRARFWAASSRRPAAVKASASASSTARRSGTSRPARATSGSPTAPRPTSTWPRATRAACANTIRNART